MGREKKEIGSLGEKLALEFLKAKGYRIKCVNFRTPFGELDIVTTHEGSIVFIEVRTRTTSSLGPPFLSVTRVKQAHIIKNALFYLKRYGRVDSSWRIDVISVKLDCQHALEKIEHIENAVEEIYY
ncbi:MAG: YraN family protein [Candidatus Omnitrophica bacterium]|nr:YraN family protein [Candidatus Omnitrophota bacterium]